MRLVAERVLVGLVSLFGFVFTAVLFFYAASPFMDKGVIPFTHSAIKDAFIFGSAGMCSFAVSTMLFAKKLWAWWSTIAFSSALFVLGIWLVWLVLHPRDEFEQNEGGGFGLFLSVVLMLPSAFALTVLSLPKVRTSFFKQD